MKSQVTTKKGDSGQTRALDGSEFSKEHPMMEALGALDTMRAHIAMLRVQMQEQQPEELAEIGFLLFLLHTCFLIGADISDPLNQKPEWHPMQLDESHLKALETEQTRLEAHLRLPRAFIVCAVTPLAALADVTATMVRTFERRLVAFQSTVPEFNKPIYRAFANRLSDYFFVLARHLEKGRHQPVNYAMMQTTPFVDSDSD